MKRSRLSSIKPLSAIIVTTLFGAVGVYMLNGAYAEEINRPHQMTQGVKYGESNRVTPKTGDIAQVTIRLSAGDTPGKSEPTNAPAFQAISVFAYDTKYYKLLSGKCQWQYGCSLSSVKIDDDPYLKLSLSESEIHKTRVAVCFNIPAKVSVHPTQTAFTYTLQRTSFDSGNRVTWFNWLHLSAEGTCKSNPTGVGLVSHGGSDRCGVAGYACDNGTGEGISCSILSGMGSGRCSGDGDGPGGDGKGPRGTGDGPGPGGSSPSPNTGTGGGGSGGSTANQQDDKPNPLPSSSPQGDKDKQPEVEPSPFFDGKLFAAGSDSDSSDVQGVSIAGRTFGFGWVYLIGGILIAGIGGFFVWRWWKKRQGKHR